MTVVIDTNVILQARAPGHDFHPILRALQEGDLILAMSTAIFLEYEEVLTARTGVVHWRQFSAALEAIAALHGNVRSVEPSFRWRLIAADPDDDKFADCAIAAEADWIVTADAHFEVLRRSGQKPQPITPHDFIARFLSSR